MKCALYACRYTWQSWTLKWRGSVVVQFLDPVQFRILFPIMWVNFIFLFDFHVPMHHVKFLKIKPTRCTNSSNLFLEWNSTCFGQFLCPSSGVFHCTHSNGICHTGLLTACEQDRDGTHHQEIFTIHIAMVYVKQICWQLACRIRMERSSILILLTSCQQTCMTYTIAICTVKISW